MKKIYRLENLDCAHCAAKIEDAVKKCDGVKEARVNFMLQRMTLECEEGDFVRIDKEVRAAAKRIEPDCVLKA